MEIGGGFFVRSKQGKVCAKELEPTTRKSLQYIPRIKNTSSKSKGDKRKDKPSLQKGT